MWFNQKWNNHTTALDMFYQQLFDLKCVQRRLFVFAFFSLQSINLQFHECVLCFYVVFFFTCGIFHIVCKPIGLDNNCKKRQFILIIQSTCLLWQIFVDWGAYDVTCVQFFFFWLSQFEFQFIWIFFNFAQQFRNVITALRGQYNHMNSRNKQD